MRRGKDGGEKGGTFPKHASNNVHEYPYASYFLRRFQSNPRRTTPLESAQRGESMPVSALHHTLPFVRLRALEQLCQPLSCQRANGL